jgi:hypothetical protein
MSAATPAHGTLKLFRNGAVGFINWLGPSALGKPQNDPLFSLTRLWHDNRNHKRTLRYWRDNHVGSAARFFDYYPKRIVARRLHVNGSESAENPTVEHSDGFA